MRIRTILQLLFICGVTLSVATLEAQTSDYSDVPQRLRVCGDIAGWPPFTFPATDGSGAAAGLNIELLDSVLAEQQRSAEYVLLPWRRCLALAETGEMDILLDILDSPQRRSQFLLPRPYYSVEMSAVSLRSRNLGPLSDVTHFETLRVCEMAGYSDYTDGLSIDYVAAGLPPTVAAAAEMLRSERCDVLLFSSTIFTGSIVTAEPSALLSDEFTYSPLPWIPQSPGYLGINRKAVYAEPLHGLIDAGIASMEANGKLTALREKYLAF